MDRFVKVTDNETLKQLAVLADEIWHEHFVNIIGKEQTDYMVKKFQSFEAMQEQIANQNYSYYAMMSNNVIFGYFAIMPDDKKLFLSKLYIHASKRNQGHASSAIEFIKKFCRKNGYGTIWLTTNRHNSASIDKYLHMGFKIAREQQADIGNGFVMDDYIMEMSVDSE